MRTSKRRAWKRFLAATALSWGIFGLLWAQMLVLPSPVLLPRLVFELAEIPATTDPRRFVVMFLKETSLLLCGFALLGLLLAALARRSGARRSSLVAAVLCAGTVVFSLVPVAQAWRTASAEGVPLSLSGYFGGFSSDTDHRPQTVMYARPGGEELRLDIWRSSSEAGATQGRPAVIMVHGGGWHSGSRSQFPRWNAWLADKGYVVFDIDYRLSPPPSWQEAPADVRCAVGWVKEHADRYGVDPERVALMGRSAGGQLALLTAYTQGESTLSPGCNARRSQDTGVAAVVAFYPPTDLDRLHLQGYLRGMGRFLGDAPGAFPAHYRLSSPVSRASPADPPTLLVHGGDDEIVPPGQSELLAAQLQEASVPYRLVELPGSGHTFDFLWGGWGSQITRFALEEFLRSHLEAPVKAGEDLSGSGQAGAVFARAYLPSDLPTAKRCCLFSATRRKPRLFSRRREAAAGRSGKPGPESSCRCSSIATQTSERLHWTRWRP